MKYSTYIIDLSVMLHDVKFWLTKLGYDLDTETLDSVLEDQFLWMHALGFLPDPMIPKRARVVYAADQKMALPSGKYHYWRHEALSKIPLAKRKRNPETKQLETKYIDYKSGREPNPADKYSKDRLTQNAYFVKTRELESFAKVKKAWYRFAEKNQLEFYQSPGYEADDVAASYVMLHPEENILLCTIDQDWIGLVTEKTKITVVDQGSVEVEKFNVAWYDVKGHQRPRLITSETVHDWAEGKGYTLSEAKDIWAIKSAEGDSSDKLPKGTPIEYISLLEPPDEHKLWIGNRLGINTRRFVKNLPDYREAEERLNGSFLENNLGIRCQLSTFYATMRT